jgi:purine-binding chemotaxis protein CheW
LAELENTTTAETAAIVPEEEVRICLFSIGGDAYALPVGILTEIIIPQKVFPVPTTPSHVLGVINLRGNIVPIVDIRPALGLSQTEEPPKQIAVLRQGPSVLGIAVDMVSEVLSVPVSSLLEIPAEHGLASRAANRNRFFRAVIQHGEGAAALLDVDQLFDAIRLA